MLQKRRILTQQFIIRVVSKTTLFETVSRVIDMNAEEEQEFAWFNGIQDKLKQAFIEGYDHPQAEELAFYVAQAVRNVPRLLQVLDNFEKHSNDEVLTAVHNVLANHFSLTEANQLVSNPRN